MSLFLKRPIALLTAALLVFGSTAAGAAAGIERESKQIESLFYSGVTYDGYQHKSIHSQLSQRTDAANGLLGLAKDKGFLSEAEELRIAREALMNARDIYSYYFNDRDLEKVFEDLQVKLYGSGLEGRDAQMLQTYLDTFRNAGRVIEKAGYNDAVRNFYDNTLNRFPANFFYDNLPIKGPDSFGNIWY